MEHAITAQKIKDLCKTNNVPISKLLVDCNIRKSLIYDLEKRTFTPSVEVLERISDYFNCSVDYLLGRTNDPKLHKLEE